MMDKTLSDQANIILQEIITSAASVKEFVLAEAPDVIHQLLTWKLIIHSMELLFGVAIMIGLMLFVKWEIKLVKKHWQDIEDGGAPILMLNVLLVIPVIVAGSFLI